MKAKSISSTDINKHTRFFKETYNQLVVLQSDAWNSPMTYLTLPAGPWHSEHAHTQRQKPFSLRQATYCSRAENPLVSEKPCKDKSSVLLKTIIKAIQSMYDLSNVISWSQYIISTPNDSTGIYPTTLIWPKYWLLLKDKSPSLSLCYPAGTATEENKGMGQCGLLHRKLGGKDERDQGRHLQLHDSQHPTQCRQLTEAWASLTASSCTSLRPSQIHSQREPHEDLQTQSCYNHTAGSCWASCFQLTPTKQLDSPGQEGSQRSCENRWSRKDKRLYILWHY